MWLDTNGPYLARGLWRNAYVSQPGLVPILVPAIVIFCLLRRKQTALMVLPVALDLLRHPAGAQS